MKVGSLFAGIGGLDLALEDCGHESVWQVEIDPFCVSILKRHWPDVKRYGDIRKIDWMAVERPDIVAAGFPCQPFSVAGERRGEDDERNLWAETYRAVRELRSRYVFLENVPGLLVHRYFGTILGDLAKGGYDAVWDTFTAAEVRAPHRRERLFILAYSSSTRLEGRRNGRTGFTAEPGRLLPPRPSELLADAAGSRQRTGFRDDDAGQPDALGRFPPGPDDRDAWARVLAEMPEVEPAVCRVAARVPDRTHRLRALGNAVVPAQGAHAFRSLWHRMVWP